MKVGIICEFNPFHNGHEFLIKQARQRWPDAIIVALMSGFATLKGDLGIVEKHERAALAINNGVDIVVEIPAYLVLNGADRFANGAILMAAKLGIDKIFFGSESNDLANIEGQVNKYISANPKTLDKTDKKESGYSFAKMNDLEHGIDLKPNDLLAFCYIKAIKQLGANVGYESIKRESNQTFTSATKVRQALVKDDKTLASKYLSYEIENPIMFSKMFEVIKHSIFTTKKLDFDNNLLNQAKKVIYEANSYDELVEKLINKTFTRSHVKRFLIRLVFGIASRIETLPSKLLVLGFKKQAQQFILENDVLATNVSDKEIFVDELRTNQILRLNFGKHIKTENSFVPLISN